MHRFQRSFLITIALLAIGVAPAIAARIYNLLPVAVQVSGFSDHVWLHAGQKSPSVSWASTYVRVQLGYGNGDGECQVNFGLHHEITGGHYMIIAHRDHELICSVCDSDYKLIGRATGQIPWYNARINDKISGKSSSKLGC